MLFRNCCFPKKKIDEIYEINTQTNLSESNSTELDLTESDLTEVNIKLHNATYKNTIKFIPSFKIAKVIKVYDGDTITVAATICKFSNVYRFNIRLMEVDTPELRTLNENEKTAARFVQKKLEELILDKIVETKIIGIDKYGRLLGFVKLVLDNGIEIDISKWLLDNKYGVYYDGGEKKSPLDWIEYMKVDL